MGQQQNHARAGMFSRTALIALFMTVLCSAGSGLVYADGLSLEEAVKTGIATNPEIGSAANRKGTTEAQLTQTRALYLPSIDLTADAGYESTQTPVLPQTSLGRSRVSMTLTQLLFDGFGTVHEIKRQKARDIAAGYRTLETSELVALNIVSSFLNVKRRRLLMEVERENIARHEELLKKIKDGTKRGKFNQGDLAQAASRLERAKVDFESVQRSLKEAESAYKDAVGLPPPEELDTPKFNVALLPGSLEELLRQAKNNNPTLAALHADFQTAAAAHASSDAGFYPRVSLEMTGEKGRNLSGIRGQEESGSALVVMRWNLFRGGADKARMKETLHEKISTGFDAETAERALEQNINDTWAARDAARKQMDAFKRQEKADKKVLEAYEDQFQIGRRTLLDLLDSTNALSASQSNRINATYSALFANYRLLALSGGLMNALDAPPPSYENIPLPPLMLKSMGLIAARKDPDSKRKLLTSTTAETAQDATQATPCPNEEEECAVVTN
ncbi:MAG: TolC family outer membrane protein [Alphaproteobacteria bacterium]|nr:TolC family outer membrane protein [Alphaproteobacteria bacterium]